MIAVAPQTGDEMKPDIEGTHGGRAAAHHRIVREHLLNRAAHHLTARTDRHNQIVARRNPSPLRRRRRRRRRTGGRSDECQQPYPLAHAIHVRHP